MKIAHRRRRYKRFIRKYGRKYPFAYVANRRFRQVGKNACKAVVIRSPSYTPDAVLVKMKFCLTTTHSGDADYQAIFAGNHLYSPYSAAASSVLPVGFYFWSGAYEQYQVMGSKIKVQTSPESTPANGRVTVLTTTDGTTAITTSAQVDLYQAHPYTVVKRLKPETPTTVVRYMSSNVAMGLPRQEVDDTHGARDWDQAYSASDPFTWFWVISWLSDSVTTFTVTETTTITYYVRWFDRKNDTQDVIPS